MFICINYHSCSFETSHDLNQHGCYPILHFLCLCASFAACLYDVLFLFLSGRLMHQQLYVRGNPTMVAKLYSTITLLLDSMMSKFRIPLFWLDSCWDMFRSPIPLLVRSLVIDSSPREMGLNLDYGKSFMMGIYTKYIDYVCV